MGKIRLKINQVTPGMKLAENLTTAEGATIMPVGIRLTPLFINRLAKWGVETLEVFQDDGPDAAANDEPAPAADDATARTAASRRQEAFARAITAEVAPWFANVRNDPLMMELRAIAIKKLVAIGPGHMINRIRRPETAVKERPS